MGISWSIQSEECILKALYVFSDITNTIFEIFGFHISLHKYWQIMEISSTMYKITRKLYWASPTLFAIKFFFPFIFFPPDIIKNNYYSSKLQSGSKFRCAKCWIFRRHSPCSKEAANLRDKKKKKIQIQMGKRNRKCNITYKHSG